ncbi:hypothetical protein [Wenzhouxiangella sp. XN24]|uniref:hypothetical protein n=1 Tax=Wenzhouxiangella sp. XN24 TaxID=2713569 RepID=UPI0013EB48FE|nr:hypothetical protein [Wenzhouxiangella sp. XN24]NGX14824.1 hypothetical protein [Wenzhouxiangella sp. XN24]
MHATTEQLLNLRDGAPVAELTAAHVRACPACRQELEELVEMRERLRGLPEVAPPVASWDAVAARLASGPEQPVRSARHAAWSWLAMAASITLALSLLWIVDHDPADRPAPGTTTDLVASTPAPSNSVPGGRATALVHASRELEAALRALPAAPRVTRASTALTVAELEDGLLRIDAELNRQGLPPEREVTLWRQRVGLMDALMQVRYAELAETY